VITQALQVSNVQLQNCVDQRDQCSWWFISKWKWTIIPITRRRSR